MTALAHLIKELVIADGPMTVDRFMTLCLGHPRHGYYMARMPFGRQGDFVTAPEVSQIFGELIGVWCLAAWEVMGRPDPIRLVELGPGRGTLMADLLRTCRIAPAFEAALRIDLVEASPRSPRASARPWRKRGSRSPGMPPSTRFRRAR